jgi:ribosomal protein S18 acetylase RimI-like enzyme
LDQLAYQEEKWTDVGHKVEELSRKQYPECDFTHGAFEFDLDMDSLNQMAENGLLHVTTARNPEIVGYIVNVVLPRHMNFKAKHAGQLGWYVHPDYRKGGIGLNLLKTSEELLKAQGVAFLSASHTINLDASPLFHRLGWKQTEMSYTKVI